MAKIRLYIDHPLAEGQGIALNPDQAHYLNSVMRQGPGDEILVFNGRDGEWRARIERLAKRGGDLLALDRTAPQLDPPDLWLIFAPIKKARTDFIVEKAAEMGAAAEAMEYERAAALRDRIKALTAVQSVQAINPRGVPEADIIALHIEGGQACVQVFFIRGNQSWGNRDFYPRLNGVESADEVMQAFLVQFYDGQVPPLPFDRP